MGVVQFSFRVGCYGAFTRVILETFDVGAGLIKNYSKNMSGKTTKKHIRQARDTSDKQETHWTSSRHIRKPRNTLDNQETHETTKTHIRQARHT